LDRLLDLEFLLFDSYLSPLTTLSHAILAPQAHAEETSFAILVFSLIQLCYQPLHQCSPSASPNFAPITSRQQLTKAALSMPTILLVALFW
jgi:hypothetical protein